MMKSIWIFQAAEALAFIALAVFLMLHAASETTHESQEAHEGAGHYVSVTLVIDDDTQRVHQEVHKMHYVSELVEIARVHSFKAIAWKTMKGSLKDYNRLLYNTHGTEIYHTEDTLFDRDMFFPTEMTLYCYTTAFEKAFFFKATTQDGEHKRYFIDEVKTMEHVGSTLGSTLSAGNLFQKKGDDTWKLYPSSEFKAVRGSYFAHAGSRKVEFIWDKDAKKLILA